MLIFAPMWMELTDLLMPRQCLVCGRTLGAAERHLCLWCAADLPLTYNWERTHHPMADAFNAALEQLRADREALPYAYASSLLRYHKENPYKAIPQAIKYHDNQAAGRFFGSLLGYQMASQPHFADIDLVIPVPLHWLRRYRRGYNQAQVIAAALAAELQATLAPRALRRVRRTRTQTRLNAEDRLRNVQGVFRARKAIQARHVLLVDDTFTTGATLAACYMAIKKATGPGTRISVATLAVVED